MSSAEGAADRNVTRANRMAKVFFVLEDTSLRPKFSVLSSQYEPILLRTENWELRTVVCYSNA